MSRSDPQVLIKDKTKDWWQDARREWCAYCGVKLIGTKGQSTSFTKDHVLPKKHRAPKAYQITIPSCRGCNTARGSQSLPEFLASEHFFKKRGSEEGAENQWPLRDLWLVMALAAVEQARSLSEAWPDRNPPPGS